MDDDTYCLSDFLEKILEIKIIYRSLNQPMAQKIL